MTRLLIPLTGHLARAVSWWPLGVAIPLAVLAQAPVLATEPSLRAVLTGLWLAAGVLGAGAGFALPDLMAATVVTPVPRWVRQWLRIGLVLAPAVLIWAVLHAVVRWAVAPEVTWPGGFMILQAAVCGLLPMAAAAIGARHRGTATGALLGPAAQGLVLVVTLFFAERSSPWSMPSADGWTTAHRVWPVALIVVVLSLLLANREAAGPHGA
ncbi:hypothetical protein QLQ12_30460 [Actinoplanes sp. NEAU-A12]|uniref:ABC transporter n=1 Tax=Actinoplanes sandaracinus TaxID=3045177 RepID=A0ABT6WT74_9ACTN|nr:hypothetical protein [Actinoplanes sandaracinus]MDI6099053.1 hypothetical protein [Actinoplanes sandaracinus]MDI6102948.1 hypothetical protein [Actinoplanes sandaracinus]